jgi:hypothetical protein
VARTRSTRTAAPAAKAAPAAPVRGGTAKAPTKAAQTAAVLDAVKAGQAPPLLPRVRLYAAAVAAMRAGLPAPLPLPWGAVKATGLATLPRRCVVVLPWEESDEVKRGGEEGAAAWMVAGGHKTADCAFTRKDAPADVKAWRKSVRAVPVPAGVLPYLPHGGWVAVSRTIKP